MGTCSCTTCDAGEQSLTIESIQTSRPTPRMAPALPHIQVRISKDISMAAFELACHTLFIEADSDGDMELEKHEFKEFTI